MWPGYEATRQQDLYMYAGKIFTAARRPRALYGQITSIFSRAGHVNFPSVTDGNFGVSSIIYSCLYCTIYGLRDTANQLSTSADRT